jgi:hypothetical protein
MHRAGPLFVAALLTSALGSACASAGAVADGGGPAATATTGDDRVTAARGQLEALATRAVAFETEHGRCISAVTDVEQPAPSDPWGHPIAFMPAGEAGPAAFVSAGPDGELLSADDVSVRVTCMGG